VWVFSSGCKIDRANPEEIVIRCPRSRDDGCGFFLWEQDEEAERERHLAAEAPQPPPPETPHSNRHWNMVNRVHGISGLPTPNSDGRSFASNRTGVLQPAVDVSPTPYRYHNNVVTSNDEEDGLFEKIFKLLQEGGVKLNRSTDVKLREVINSTVFSYDARIRTLEMSVKDLDKHLQEMEGNGS